MNIYKRDGRITLISFEPDDTLEQIASTMKCSVYELIDAIEILRMNGWSGEDLEWGFDNE